MNGKTRSSEMPDRPEFFDAGIRFECTGCGECCTGAPGTVYINRREASAIARRLGLDLKAFLETYAYPFKNGYSLREKENYDCIFFQDGRCSIYDVRPTQCRTYPFWPETLRSEAAWRHTCRACEGIGRGRLYSKKEILAEVQKVLDAGEPVDD